MMDDISRLLMAALTQASVYLGSLTDKQPSALAPFLAIIKIFCEISHADISSKAVLLFTTAGVFFLKSLPVVSFDLGYKILRKAAIYADLKAQNHVTFFLIKKGIS